ncbi:hypothetical protein [Pseudomonas sp. SMN5]|uniref:hypothetical protein n=1 Tax=Pseudomonas sp. SMN5 TaxID=3390198 RepID=UPI003F8522B0
MTAAMRTMPTVKPINNHFKTFIPKDGLDFRRERFHRKSHFFGASGAGGRVFENDAPALVTDSHGVASRLGKGLQYL